MSTNLACDKFWVNKNIYHDAEKKYHECAAKLQRRLEIFGPKSQETNNNKNNIKNWKKFKKCHDSIDINELQKELYNLEAQENAKNKTFHSETHCFEIIKPKEDYDKKENFIDSEKKIQNKEQQKEKKNKSEKKPKRTKENEDDLLGSVEMKKINRDDFPKTSLAGEVAKARQHIKSSLECMESMNGMGNLSNTRLIALLEKMQSSIDNLTKRVELLEKECASRKKTANPPVDVCLANQKAQAAPKPTAKKCEEDDLDLFESESEEENEESKKIKERRLAEYEAKKSKKPALVAKSNIILDIKPWDNETDMKEMEKAVRGVKMDGLLWGASKLVPVAFKIFKLQISCVIEDDKVSVDLLTEALEEIQDYIQSVDIAAFNKV